MDSFDVFRALARLLGVLLRPAGFLGVGFFVAFVGVSWVLDQNPKPLPPTIPARDHLSTVEGPIADFSFAPIESRRGKESEINVAIGAEPPTRRYFNVPYSILDHVPYLELRGKAIRLLVDDKHTVYEAEIQGAVFLDYADVVAVAGKRRADAALSAQRYRYWGILLALLGTLQFITGVWWWQRRGYP